MNSILTEIETDYEIFLISWKSIQKQSSKLSIKKIASSFPSFHSWQQVNIIIYKSQTTNSMTNLKNGFHVIITLEVEISKGMQRSGLLSLKGFKLFLISQESRLKKRTRSVMKSIMLIFSPYFSTRFFCLSVWLSISSISFYLWLICWRVKTAPNSSQRKTSQHKVRIRHPSFLLIRIHESNYLTCLSSCVRLSSRFKWILSSIYLSDGRAFMHRF